MRILGGPCNIGSEPGPYKPGRVGMCARARARTHTYTHTLLYLPSDFLPSPHFVDE